MARRVDIVPHTHWDREWYRTFQQFRMRLVDLLDGLLDRLDDDPGYAHFMLDGQMAVVDDYLAIRPGEEDRIRRLATAGRLSLGPWYILMDEFLVSGETMVRDLEMGLDRAASFGGAMEVGYLPDMFGHVAQMPQILAGFGFTEAVVWRGVPAEIDAPAFRWRSPDGSEVVAEFLTDGYSNGAVLPDDAKELLARVAAWAERHGPRAGDPLLWMNGTDHLMPQPRLGRLVAEAADLSDDWDLRISSLPQHLAARLDAVERAGGPSTLPEWTGELRSGARSNLLMGVTSNRVDVRQLAARAEVGLERRAEPLAALFAPADAWPAGFLAEAWRHVVRNAAHDSICACSVDPVVDAVVHRYGEVIDLVDGLVARSLRTIGAAAGGEDPVLVNPLAHDRTDLVDLVLEGRDEAPAGTQLLAVHGARRRVDAGSRANLGEVVGRVLDTDRTITSVEVVEEGATISVVATAGGDGTVDRDELRRRIAHVSAAGSPATPVTAFRDGAPSVRFLARAAAPGFGWRRFAPIPARHPVTAAATADGGARLDNGLVTVEVDPGDGTWSLGGVAGLGRLVDGGDHGDTYNWCPPPAGDALVDRPDSVSVTVEETGPLRAVVRIDTRWTWPEAIVEGARAGAVDTPVSTTLTLHADDEVVRVETTIDNRSRDHRVRVHLPLPERASTSRAGCAFATVTRGLEAEGGPTEQPLPTYPARDHVTAGRLTVLTEGVMEYELVDIAGPGDAAGGAATLALTLLRATGLLSQGPMETRPVPAGPVVETPAAQVPGPLTVRYGLAVDLDRAEARAAEVFVPMLVALPRGPHRADEHRALRIEGAEVSCVRRRGGRLEVRVWNPSDSEVTVTVDRTGWVTDLRGRPLERIEGRVALRPAGIATLSLDDPV
ncbi:MAG: alpha-mannosidase [Acidimicrobiales bacterium]|nr:alpha-mannosidase [Acidimicrobiales bacterium]